MRTVCMCVRACYGYFKLQETQVYTATNKRASTTTLRKQHKLRKHSLFNFRQVQMRVRVLEDLLEEHEPVLLEELAPFEGALHVFHVTRLVAIEVNKCRFIFVHQLHKHKRHHQR